DNNWDFIPPERRRRQQGRDKLQRDLFKAKKVLAELRKKANDDFIENAPANIVSEMKLRLANQERAVKELEDRIAQHSSS
ncbi:MAG: hypothetical protein P1Q69_21020, partial [Candidatus Thorarchaeota archaeon]|nr:hypothetical protein [Candidatus Thorarchaeota archaeon]